jgi:hypothetical protein
MSKTRKEAMVHVNVRLPVYVLEYFMQQNNYTKAIRAALEQHVAQATEVDARAEANNS